MAVRSNALLSALASAVRLNPRLSAGFAFELGVMVGAFVKLARLRGLKGASAKLIHAMPLISHAAPARQTAARKSVARKRKPARRARVAAQHS